MYGAALGVGRRDKINRASKHRLSRVNMADRMGKNIGLQWGEVLWVQGNHRPFLVSLLIPLSKGEAKCHEETAGQRTT